MFLSSANWEFSSVVHVGGATSSSKGKQKEGLIERTRAHRAQRTPRNATMRQEHVARTLGREIRRG